MKKRIMAGIMATMMVFTMMQTTAFAESKKQWNHLLKRYVKCLTIRQS